MRKNIFTLLSALGLIILLGLACKKEDSSGLPGNCGDGLSWTNLVSEEYNDLIEASTAYSTDPSPSNCLNYKNSYTDYLNALNAITACVLCR